MRGVIPFPFPKVFSIPCLLSLCPASITSAPAAFESSQHLSTILSFHGMRGKSARVYLSPCLAVVRSVTLFPVRYVLNPWKIRADFASRVTPGESIGYLRDILASCGRRRSVALLGVPAETLNKWLDGQRNPSKTARRAIFLVWYLLRYPHPSLTPFDIMTEGRFMLVPAPLQVDACGVSSEATKHNGTQANE